MTKFGFIILALVLVLFGASMWMSQFDSGIRYSPSDNAVGGRTIPLGESADRDPASP